MNILSIAIGVPEHQFGFRLSMKSDGRFNPAATGELEQVALACLRSASFDW